VRPGRGHEPLGQLLDRDLAEVRVNVVALVLADFDRPLEPPSVPRTLRTSSSAETRSMGTVAPDGKIIE
jgi:hypothetical protein